MAWGLTNAYFDTIDLAAVSEDEISSLKSERPTIWFKLWKLKIPFVFKSFVRTPAQEFPVLPIDGPKGKKFVLKWSGFFVEAKDIEAALDIPYAADATAMNETLKQIRIPAWNFVFADSTGKIGYRAVGKVPSRKMEPAEGVVDASLKDWDQPYASYWNEEEVPNLFRPARGFVATANQSQWGEKRPRPLGRVGNESFRAFRVEELLLQKDVLHDFESLRRIQCDQQAVDGRFFAKHLAEFVPALDRAIRYQLEQWDFDTQADCRICGLYRRWMEKIVEETSLNESQIFYVMTKRRELIAPAIEKAYIEAKKDLGIVEPTQVPKWGQIHRARFLTALGDSFDPFVPSPVGMETAGDKHSVNPGESRYIDRMYEQDWGASQRLLVELSPRAKVYLSFPGTTTETLRRDFKSPESPWVEWKNCIYHPVEVSYGDSSSALKWMDLPTDKSVP
jgi:penicillin amidase